MAELRVDLDGIRHNTAAVAALLARVDMRLVAVTKGCVGDVRVARAMLDGGAQALADTRDAHLRRLREAFPGVELHRIYLPSFSSAFEPGDISYVSSVEAAIRVAEQGCASGRGSVMVQVETGDLREGVPPDGLIPLLEAVAADPRLEPAGVSTNYACFDGDAAGIRESVRSLAAAVQAARAAGFEVRRVSGGNSSLLALLVDGVELPSEITELRCGEALLLGQDALVYRPLPGCRRDAVVLRAEVLESYTKASREGTCRRLVLGLGHQDIGCGKVEFRFPELREVGRSSDYMVVV
ncbi:MAG TPA: alanine racemase, partial [Thermoleophilia bacterium]|nr:alanine racemase [Thermoleophilia bacterium]